MKSISIVSTLYHSADYIDEFYRRIINTLKKLNLVSNYEIVFVNDGSPDNSLGKAIKICDLDSNVKTIDLSRNFGHHKAIMTGLKYASGKYIFLIDVDLEERPELLEDFWKEIHLRKNDVVFGVQKQRKGNYFERYTGELFYSLFNFLSDIKIPKNPITARIMTSQYVSELVRHEDKTVFFLGLASTTGFNQSYLTCKKTSTSKTTYTLSKKLNQFVNSITAFTAKPLTYIFRLGFLMSLLSLLFIVYIVLKRLFFDIPTEGWASLIVSVFFLGGLILASIGVVGIYISRIFDEVKNRPLTIIKKIYG